MEDVGGKAVQVVQSSKASCFRKLRSETHRPRVVQVVSARALARYPIRGIGYIMPRRIRARAIAQRALSIQLYADQVAVVERLGALLNEDRVEVIRMAVDVLWAALKVDPAETQAEFVRRVLNIDNAHLESVVAKLSKQGR